MPSSEPEGTSYETVRSEVKRFGKNSYMEVSRQRLRQGKTATDFLVVTRGYFEKDGTRQWTRFVTVPDDPQLKAWLRRSLRRV